MILAIIIYLIIKITRFAEMIRCLFGLHDWHFFYADFKRRKFYKGCTYCTKLKRISSTEYHENKTVNK